MTKKSGKLIQSISMDHRYWFIGLVLVAGIFISVQFYNVTRANEVAQARHAFEGKAADRLESIKQSITAKQDIVRSLVAYFDGSKNVDRQEFRLFAGAALKRFPSVQALEWVPKVSASNRSAFEERARQDGLGGFRFTERSGDGKPITAKPRDQYFPVYYVEPYEGNEAALGLDLGSHTTGRAAMGKAQDTNMLTASEKIELVQGGAGILIFAPVYGTSLLNETVLQRRQNLRGFALGVLNVKKLVESIFKTRQTLQTPSGIDVYLYDDDAPSAQGLLYFHRSRTRTSSKEPVLTRAEVETGPHVNQLFLVGNRTWNVIAKPVRPDFGHSLSLMALGAAGLPALLAMVFAAYLHTLFSQSHRLENEIAERRRAEEDLGKSDKQFRAAFDQDAVGMAIRNVGPHDSRWLSVNQKFCDIFGYTREEMLQLTSIDVSPPEEQHIAVEFNERILRGEITSYSREKRYMRKDGHIFWSNIWLSPILGHDGAPTQIIQVIEDITARKQMEEALKESEAQFRTVVNSSPAAITLKNRDGLYLLVNQTYGKWMNVDPSKLVGKTVYDWFPQEQADDIEANDQKVIETGVGVVSEAIRSFNDGLIRSVITHKAPIFTVNGEAIGVSTVITDITERKQAEVALMASESRLAEVLHIAPEAVVTVGADMNIQLFNQGAERIFGYTAEEMLGQSLEILMPEGFREDHRRHIEGFDRSGDTYRLMDRRQEILGLRKDGTEFPASASVSKLEVGDEKIFTVMLQDITERKEALDGLMAAKEEAEAANRSKSEFLAAMSHDLRTPLNAIIGFSDFISNQYFGPVGDKYQEYAKDIKTSGELLLLLINDILDLSAIESGKQSLSKEDISITDVVTECETIIKKKAQSLGLNLVTKVSKDLPSLYADRRAITQILLNLLSNSVKFTPEGGKITLRVTATNKHHTIEVSDTGMGILADKIATITDPFVRGETDPHKSQQGTGLGLAIVKSLVDLHDGELDIKSTVAKGTTVTVTLPNTA